MLVRLPIPTEHRQDDGEVVQIDHRGVSVGLVAGDVERTFQPRASFRQFLRGQGDHAQQVLRSGLTLCAVGPSGEVQCLFAVCARRSPVLHVVEGPCQRRLRPALEGRIISGGGMLRSASRRSQPSLVATSVKAEEGALDGDERLLAAIAESLGDPLQLIESSALFLPISLERRRLLPTEKQLIASFEVVFGGQG